MTDKDEQRSRRSLLMSRVRREHTTPEVVVRRYLHGAGFRYILHDHRLPGTPDVVLPRFKCAVFVNGCFWHRHESCSRASTPKTRVDFWQAKFDGNVARDRAAHTELEQLGWRVTVIWECETRHLDGLHARFKPLFLLRTGKSKRGPEARPSRT